MSRKIKIIKYNSSLDKVVQNFSSFDSYLQISRNKDELVIFNKKPIEFQKYILEADPEVVENARRDHLIEE